jgi:hypothetical protein
MPEIMTLGRVAGVPVSVAARALREHSSSVANIRMIGRIPLVRGLARAVGEYEYSALVARKHREKL